MTNAAKFYTGIPDGHGGVILLPKKGSPMEAAMKRLYPGVRFHDAPMDMGLPPMNNLSIPNKAFRLPGDKARDRRRMRDNGDPPPLDDDLRELARQAGSQAMVEQVYEEQRKRDKRREMNGGNGDDCFARDQQLPDPDMMEDPDHEEPDGDEPQILATVDPPPDGYILTLVPQGNDGTVALVLQPDLGNREDPDLNTSDRTYRHRISDGKDKTLVRMNQIHRGVHLRDAVTNTLLRHRCLPGNRIVLRENEFGSIDVILISWAPGDDLFEQQGGAEELDDSDQSDQPAEAWVFGRAPGQPGERELPNPTFRDSYRLPEAVALRNMNAQAKAFWARR